MTRIAIYAGSFDPVTRGHEDLIHRSLEYVDRLVVAVANNSSKQPLFTLDERVEFIRVAADGDDRIEVRQFSGLLVEFAREIGARLLIRGLRAVADFEYEYQMALMNRHLSAELETVFMVPTLETTYISSSLVREVAKFRGDVTGLVHPVVADALVAKYGAASRPASDILQHPAAIAAAAAAAASAPGDGASIGGDGAASGVRAGMNSGRMSAFPIKDRG